MVQAVDAVVPKDWDIVVGGGHQAYFPAQMVGRPAERYTTVREFGAVGNGLSYALGRRYEHVLGLVAGLNAYTKVFSEPSNGDSAATWGLDKGGAAGYLGFGYTYRFNTPFGSSPFVTLE